MEYNSAFKSQLVDPNKIMEMLNLLKISKNPYYQFYENFDNFKQRCRISDPEGFNILFHDEIEEDLCDTNRCSYSNLEDEIQSNEVIKMNENKNDNNEKNYFE